MAALPDLVTSALVDIPIRALNVSAVEPGTVYLDGAVRSEEDRDRAEQQARQVPGVSVVVNDLAVDPLVVDATPDDVLAPDHAVDDLGPAGVVGGTEPDLNDAIGTTDTALATDEAVPYFPPTDPPTRRAPRLDEDIEVVGGFSPTADATPVELEQRPERLFAGDDEIAREVRLALAEDAATADLPIHVFVRDGVVHLRGTVRSLDDAELAESVASGVGGVFEVREELDVAGV